MLQNSDLTDKILLLCQRLILCSFRSGDQEKHSFPNKGIFPRIVGKPYLGQFSLKEDTLYTNVHENRNLKTRSRSYYKGEEHTSCFIYWLFQNSYLGNCPVTLQLRNLVYKLVLNQSSRFSHLFLQHSIFTATALLVTARNILVKLYFQIFSH